MLRACDQGRACIARTGGHGEHAKTDGDEGRARSDVHGACAGNGVAAGDVTRLVRDDALDLARRFRSDQQASVQVDILAIRDEGVEAGIIDDVKPDILRIEAGDFKDRIGPFAQRRLDLGIPDQALRRRAHRSGERCPGGDGGFQKTWSHE